MAPTIHCVRHAQGYHNLSIANHSLPDPSLTPFGKEQCQQLHEAFPYHAQVDLLVASPLRRTIYTTLLGFESETQRGLAVIALPEIQETSDLPCDTGSPLPRIQQEFADQPVDLSLVHDGWDSKAGVPTRQGKWAAHAEQVRERAKYARQWLKARPEKHIVVVTHGGFLHYFTEDWTDAGLYQGTGWANTEFRSYTFKPTTGDEDNASMTETKESLARRKGSETPLNATERREWSATTPSPTGPQTTDKDAAPATGPATQSRF
ncbi:MAG: hypothetical protein M1838_003910 [Thelocarpon superellum]|nr:MAG: hypothetical protein M1838_003910 [Thelocarpon superellum]